MTSGPLVGARLQRRRDYPEISFVSVQCARFINVAAIRLRAISSYSPDYFTGVFEYAVLFGFKRTSGRLCPFVRTRAASCFVRSKMILLIIIVTIRSLYERL